MALNLIDWTLLGIMAFYLVRHFRTGVFPLLYGLVTLAVGVSILLFLFVFFPFSSTIQRSIETSVLGNVAVNQLADFEGKLYQVFGRTLELFIEPEASEVLVLPFKPSETSIDANSEREMFELVNDARLEAGLHPLLLDDTLTIVAQKHSQDMWERQYFAHENPDGETPFD